jgi:hypothetical protein
MLPHSKRLAFLVAVTFVGAAPLGRIHAFTPGDQPPATKAADKQPALPEIPADLIDPAFAGKVDLAGIRQAIGELDAKALMDHAEKLLIAERQLGKKHKSLHFGALVDLALRITSDKHDAESLDHIAQALGRLLIKDFDEKLAATRLLLDRPRKISAGPNVPLSETTPNAIVRYNALLKQVKIALNVGDRRALASMKQKIQRLSELHVKQRQHLLLMCDEAIAALPSDVPVETLALSKLSGPLYLQ